MYMCVTFLCKQPYFPNMKIKVYIHLSACDEAPGEFVCCKNTVLINMSNFSQLHEYSAIYDVYIFK